MTQVPDARGRVLVCVVEGQGEVDAIPALCSRIRDYLEAWTWRVHPDPIRHPRSLLVDQRIESPNRPARKEALERILEQAAARPADAVLFLCDADDDCPVTWAKSANAIIAERHAGAAVMAVREFEAWLLASRLDRSVVSGRPIHAVADAKGALRRLVPGYKPTVHQLKLTREIDVESLRVHARSFDKLVRSLAGVFGVTAPTVGGAGAPKVERKPRRRGRR